MATALEAICCLGEYRRRVLLAHGNSDILEDLRDALVRAGFDVVLATDVTTAHICLDRYSFDVCIAEYALSDTNAKTPESQAGGESVGLRFKELSTESYQTAWVLIAKEEDEVRAFRNAFRHGQGPPPIVNISSVANGHGVPAKDVSPWDAIAKNLLDFIEKQVDFFWNMPVALEADVDDVQNTLESVARIARKRRYGDGEHSGREMLGEALRLAVRKKTADAPSPPLARATLLPDQGYAATVMTLSLPEPGIAPRLVKVANADDGEREVKNFETYVEGRDFFSRTQRLHNAQTIRGDLHVILYAYHAHFDRLTTRLRDLSLVPSNVQLIRTLFEELHRVWYGHGRWNIHHSPMKIIQSWDNIPGQPLLSTQHLSSYWDKYFHKRGRRAFDWAADGEKLFANVETLPKLLEFIRSHRSPCRDWRAITHGDLHSMNVLVSSRSEITLSDFSEVQEEGSVLQDAAQFETHLMLDLVDSRDKSDEDDSLLIDALYEALPRISLSSSSFLPQSHVHAVHSYVSAVRDAVAGLAGTNETIAKELQIGYALALLVQFVRRWKYLEEDRRRYTDRVRWRTLSCTDRIARSLLTALDI